MLRILLIVAVLCSALVAVGCHGEVGGGVGKTAVLPAK